VVYRWCDLGLDRVPSQHGTPVCHAVDGILAQDLAVCDAIAMATRDAGLLQVHVHQRNRGDPMRRQTGMRRTSTAAAVILLALALAACGDDGAGAPPGGTTGSTEAPTTDAPTTTVTSPATTPAPPTTSTPDRTSRPAPPGGLPEPVPSTSMSPPITGQVPTPLLDEIVADASDRTGVEPAAIVTVQAQAVTWPDGSLGCPEPDVAYTQALVPGYWVVLDAGGTMLDYRVGRAGSFILCESPLATPPPGVNPSA
jgi:hypothetical protein